jgi:Concanavalin A-like lectin/glucanases superfamily/Domain of unknown function (DUF2341)
MKRTIMVSCLSAIALFLGCSRNQLTGGPGGSSSEVVGRAVYSNGQPARGAIVRLRGADYVADTSLVSLSSQTGNDADGITDDSGAFTLNNVGRGDYSIEVNDLMSNAALISCRVSVLDSLFVVPADTLKPTGSISGTLSASSTAWGNVFVQVYGLRRIARISTALAKFVINDVPSGHYTVRIISSGAGGAHKIGDVEVAPGAQTDLGTVEATSPANTYQYSRQITLNTSASGAAVFNNVYNFPALIRLRDATFNFSQAQGRGQDLRFIKADSSDLPFEIERWDSAQGQAEIWVKLDTVLGNDASQYITMLWGNPLALGRSNSVAVFDTGAGFQGVWHLAQTGNGVASDATANHFDGMSMGMNATSSAPGAIGLAQSFDGSSSYIQIPGTAGSVLNFPENGRYTVSAWVYSDTLDTLNHCIFSKGHEQYYLKQKWSMMPLSEWEFVEYHDKAGWQSTEATAAQNTWTYLVGKRDGNKQYLYANGALIDSTYFMNYGSAFRNTSGDCTIGRFMQSVTNPSNDGYCYFNGTIDEVRVSNVVLSPDWIKLCYMNQKAIDALIVLGK